jgi:hypothetical protein
LKDTATVNQMEKKSKKDFKNLLLNHGFNEKAADALW